MPCLPSLSRCSSTGPPSTIPSDKSTCQNLCVDTRKTAWGGLRKRRGIWLLSHAPAPSPPPLEGPRSQENRLGTGAGTLSALAQTQHAPLCLWKPWPGLLPHSCNHHHYCNRAMATWRKHHFTTPKVRKPFKHIFFFVLACCFLTFSPSPHEKFIWLRFTVSISFKTSISTSSCFQISKN